MPRPREYDEQAVLEKAMQLFWMQGYQAASMNDLLAATELSRSSFYEAFGTKRELLLAALARYTQSGMCGLAEPLMRPEAARAEIEQVFANMVAHALIPQGRRGCFVNNCTVELAQHDAEVLAAVNAARSGLELAIAVAVERGQAEGSITSSETPQALARFLASSLSGINLMAKAQPDRAVLGDVARVSLSVLGEASRVELKQRRIN